MVASHLDMKFSIKSKFNYYDVKFIVNIENTLNPLIKKNNNFFIIDSFVYKKYLSKLKFNKNKLIIVKAGEDKKELSNIKKIILDLLKKKINRKSFIISIGGGVIQDISAFISSILFRGIKWIYFPTTLISQGDSCIGSKTSVNINKFKNQLGNFYPPQKIYIANSFLASLNYKDYYSGLGEISHILALGNKKIFFSIKKYFNDKKNIFNLILSSLMMKKKIIEQDEFENNKRELLAFGHSVGHAIEGSTNFKIKHGISVAYGMDAAFYISYKLKFLSYKKYTELSEPLKTIIKVQKYNLNINKFIKCLLKDKKIYKEKFLDIILSKGCGKMFLRSIEIDKNFRSIIIDWKKQI